MRVSMVAAGFLALVFLAGPATAQSQPASPQKTETPTVDVVDNKDAEKVICRTEELTGARARKTRVCKTESEWSNNGRRDLNRGLNEMSKDRERALAPLPKSSGG